MTVKELVYDYFFPEGGGRSKKRDILFKLAKRGTDISKKENIESLYRGSPVQPVFLYNKQVIKFWIETWSRTNHYVIWVLYDEFDELPKEQETIFLRDGHHIRCMHCGEYWCDSDREGNPFPMNFCPHCGKAAKLSE